MSIRTWFARVFFVFIAVGVVAADLAVAREIPSDGRPTGFVLDRLSASDLRTWGAIEDVVTASGPSGRPRSRTLRRLWDWARGSGHVLYVEMVDSSEIETGIAGRFSIERVDPAGRRHTAVIRLCLENIRFAVVKPRRGADDSLVRFQGLTEVERYAEVLAHELAHAEYALDDPVLMARLDAAREAKEELFAGTERAIDRLPLDLRRRLREGIAVVADTEVYADSVEAAVLAELESRAR